MSSTTSQLIIQDIADPNGLVTISNAVIQRTITDVIIGQDGKLASQEKPEPVFVGVLPIQIFMSHETVNARNKANQTDYLDQSLQIWATGDYTIAIMEELPIWARLTPWINDENQELLMFTGNTSFEAVPVTIPKQFIFIHAKEGSAFRHQHCGCFFTYEDNTPILHAMGIPNAFPEGGLCLGQAHHYRTIFFSLWALFNNLPNGDLFRATPMTLFRQDTDRISWNGQLMNHPPGFGGTANRHPFETAQKLLLTLKRNIERAFQEGDSDTENNPAI